MDFFSHTAAVATANLFSAALFVYNLRYSSLLMTTCCLPSSLCFCLNILPLSPPAGWSRLHRHGTGAQPIPVHVCSSSAHQMLASLLRLRWPHQVGGRSDPGRLQPVQSSQSDQCSERHNRGLFVGRVQVKCCFVFFSTLMLRTNIQQNPTRLSPQGYNTQSHGWFCSPQVECIDFSSKLLIDNTLFLVVSYRRHCCAAHILYTSIDSSSHCLSLPLFVRNNWEAVTNDY